MKSKNQSRLELLDPELARQVESIQGDQKLRLFACESAKLALKYCGTNDDHSWMSVEVARQYAIGETSDRELNKAYIQANQAAETADSIAFKVHDAFEQRKASSKEYDLAFGIARAAFSARDCCRPAASDAAINASYEAWAALRTLVENGDTLGGLLPKNMSEDSIDPAIVGELRKLIVNID